MTLNEGKSGIVFLKKTGDNKGMAGLKGKDFEGIPIKR